MEQQIEWAFKLAEQDFEIVGVVVGDDMRDRAGDVQWSSRFGFGCLFVHLTLSAGQTSETKDAVQRCTRALSCLFTTLVQNFVDLPVGAPWHALLKRRENPEI